MAAAVERVDRSTLRLSEVARHVVMPTGIVDTLWFEVADRCAEFGDEFDTWQDGLGQIVLGLREDGMLAASIGGVTLSIPRQVAKTFTVGRICFALCTLHEGLNVVWTAHRVSTATSAFRSLIGMARRPAVKPHVRAIRMGNGEMAFFFANGSSFRFGARAQSFGRGETEIDIEVFDEAQILTTDTLEDMVPAANQARFEHGALLFFMGTPPRPKDPGEEFAARRRVALEAKPAGQVVAVQGDALYVECSADPNTGRPDGPDLMDVSQIERANPSYPSRTPWLSILRMRKQLKSDDSWRREALGIWDDDGIRLWQVVGRKTWAALATAIAPTDGDVAYAVKFSADGQRVGCGAAIRPADGPVFVEALGVEALERGTAALVAWLAEPRRWRAGRIVIDGKAGAGDLHARLVAAGVPRRRAHVVTTDEAIMSHAGILRAIREGSLTHSGQPGLDAAVRVAGRRPIGTAGGFGWKPVLEDGDTTAFDAVTLAFGAVGVRRVSMGGRTGSGSRTTTSGRRAVIS